MINPILLSIVIYVASIVGTVAGFGSSTVLLPVLLLFIPYVPAQFFVAVLHLFGDVWKIILFRRAKTKPWLIIASFAVGGSIMSYLGATISVHAPDVLFKVFGFFLLLYTTFIVYEPKFRVKPTPQAAVLGGTVSGLCAGLFGVRGAIRSAFLHAFGFAPYAYLFATGASSLPIDIARIVVYASNGTVLTIPFKTIPVYLLASLFGAITGKMLIKRIPQERFRQLVAGLLALLAIRLIFF